MSDHREALRSWLELLNASSAIKKYTDTEFRAQFGLSISRFDVLAALDRAGPEGLRAGALSQRLMVTDGNTTQVTAPLIRDGLVKRRTCMEDARVAYFSLTKKGERLFAKMAVAHQGWIADLFAELSKPELAMLQKLLGKIDLAQAGRKSRKDAA